MEFQTEKVDTFLKEVFEQSAPVIRSFPGCDSMELLRDLKEPNVFFTYSVWQKESDLEKYRQSEFFQKVWKKTKECFATKPEAWSVEVVG